MELEKHIQSVLWKKLPDYLGLKFYNTLPNNTPTFPFLKLEEISARQILFAPLMFELSATLKVVSDSKSNVEAIETYYQIKKLFKQNDFFDLGEKLAEVNIGEPKFKQNSDNTWMAEFQTNFKIITNIGDSIC